MTISMGGQPGQRETTSAGGDFRESWLDAGIVCE